MYLDNLPLIGGGVVVAVLVWVFMNGRFKAPVKIVIPQFMFTALGAVHYLKADSVAGVMITENHGGQKEDNRAVAIFRSGRLWFHPKPGRDPNNYRSRVLCYVTRQADSSVANLGALFDSNLTMWGTHTKEELKPIRNLAARKAMSDAVVKPGSRDILTKRLSIMAIISLVSAGIAWITITIGAFLSA